MQKNKKLKARILSLAMSAMMVATSIPAPVFAAREGGTWPDADASGVIVSFDKLGDRFEPSTGKDAPEHIYGLAVELDTPFEDLELPTELTAMVSRTSVEEAPSEAPKEPETTEAETAEVETTETEETEAETTEAETTEAESTETETTEAETTEAEPTEAETTEAEPTEAEPAEAETTEAEITEAETTETEEPETEAAEAEDEKTASTENADDSNIISAFGKTAGDFALVSEETIPVTWTGNKEYKSDENGKFIYTAELPEGYTLADGVKLPRIYVLVGRQARGGITQRTTQLKIDKKTATEDRLATEGWKWDTTTATLTLKNANFNVLGKSAISLDIATTVVLEGTNTITATDREALFSEMAVTVDMVAGSNTTISSNQNTVNTKGLTVQGDGELSVATSSSNENHAIVVPKHEVVIKGKSVVHTESTSTNYFASAFSIQDLTIEDDAVFIAKVPSIVAASGMIYGSFTATGKAITCNIGDATGYTSSAFFRGSFFYEGTTDSNKSVKAKDIKIANAAATSAITITDSGTEYAGSTLEDAVSKLSGGATAVTSLNITAGKVTEVDWNYLKSLTALTTFEIADDAVVTDVANIPPGLPDVSIFPPSIVTITVPQAITIGNYAFNGCSALTTVNFPKATSIAVCAFFNCTALTSVSFPAVTFINLSAFSGCTALTTASFPKVTGIELSAFKDCTKLATLKLGATPPGVGTNPYGGSSFTNCPATRALGYVDASGTALTGDALTAAQAAYKAKDDGNTGDGLWYGWTIASATTHTITASAGTGGSISPSGTVTVNNGESKTFTISANSNYSIASVTVDGVNQGTNSTYTFSNVTGNHTISAAFSSTGGGGGGGSSSDRQAIWTSVPSAYQGGTKIIGNVRVPDYTVEGTWKKNDNGTWNFSGNAGQVYVNCWAPVFNPYADVTKGQSAFDWFKFDANGIMLTGWHTDTDGSTYYLNPTSDNTLGAMKTGWVLIDGKYYYFNEKPDGTRGKLLRNTTTPDGYLVDENGVRIGIEK